MITKKCVQCKNEFTLSDGEIEFYKQKGLNIPKRCEKCRKENKKTNGSVTVYGSQPSSKVRTERVNNSPYAYKKTKEYKSYKSVLCILVLIAAIIGGVVKGADYFSNKSNSEASSYNVIEQYNSYTFRTSKQLTSHFEKHGSEVGAKNEMDYVDKANAVISNPDALYKTEAEDGDAVYFLRSTGEIVFLSTDGYIRTYFIADYDYFNRQ